MEWKSLHQKDMKSSNDFQSLRIEHWFDVHNIKIVGFKAVELNILVVNPKLNVSLKWFF